MSNQNQNPINTQGVNNEQSSASDSSAEFNNEVYNSDENPDNVEDLDDLHEIQADDDLNEPNAEDESDLEDNDEEDDTDSKDTSANDIDGNGGYPDDANALNGHA